MEDSICCEGDYGPFEGSVNDEVVHGHYRREGTWCPEIVELVSSRCFREGRGTFIDVGANIGLVSIPIVKRSGVRCLAFEPEPRNFHWLERNIAAHGLDGFFGVFNVALHSEKGPLRFELSPSNHGDHRVRGNGTEGRDTQRELIEVEADRLDDLVKARTLQRPIVTKIDAQGSEVQILRGAKRLLPFIDYLICEYWPYGLRRMGDRAEELTALLRGFSHGAILGEGDGPPRLVPIDRLLERLATFPTDGSSNWFFDLFLTRSAELP
jgi:FkbM family methyltransferase